MTDERDREFSGLVSRRYRELGADEPPRALDEAILAAARREVESHPAPLVAPTGRRRWYVPLAAAAVIVLSVAVTLHVQLDQSDVNGIAPRAEKPAPPAAPAPAKSPVEAPAKAAAEPAMPARRPSASKAEPRPFVPDPAPAVAPPAAAPTPAAGVASRSDAAAGASQALLMRSEEDVRPKIQERQAPMAQATPAPPPAAKPAPAPAAAPRPALKPMPLRDWPAEMSPEKELERIADLRRRERHEEADKALAEFRKRYPDYKISGEMLERVEQR